MNKPLKNCLKPHLDTLYRTWNRKEYIHPDPLEFLHRYEQMEDREIAGMIAASLAYGRVKQILRSVSVILRVMGPSPAEYVRTVTSRSLKSDLSGFRHRFAGETHMLSFITGLKRIVAEHGTLYACFLSGLREEDSTVLEALSHFAGCMNGGIGNAGHLVPSPAKGSACKRLNLYLRWMVREDAVDPGGWNSVPPEKLIIPLDVHMHRVGLGLGFTLRKQADMKTAIEVTAGFRNIAPEDPVRYDFALTRLGIRSGENLETYLENCRKES